MPFDPRVELSAIDDRCSAASFDFISGINILTMNVRYAYRIAAPSYAGMPNLNCRLID